MKLRLRRSLFCALVLTSFTALAGAQSASEAWQSLFDGVAQVDDQHNSIAATADGGVVVCGFSYEEDVPGSGIFVPRAAVRSLDASGQVRWTQVFASGAFGGTAFPTRVALQPSGRAVVGGATDFGEDWFVVGYEPNGVQAFATVWDLNSQLLAQPADLALDAAGNIYLCGDVSDPTFGAAPAVAKFSSNGTFLWSTTLDATLQLTTVRGLGVDAGGNVYVAGSLASGFAYDFTVAKLDASGTFQWTRSHGSIDPSGNDFGLDVHVDAAGRVLAGGYVSNDLMTSMDASSVAYSSTGQLLWRADWDGPNGASEFVNATAFDDFGRILLGGWRFSNAFDREAFVVAFEPGGTLAWSHVLAQAGTDEEVLTLATDGGGAALAGGISMGFTGRTGFVSVLRPDGTLAGSFSYGASTGDTYFLGACAGDVGRWFAAGQLAAPGTAPDGLALAFDSGALESFCQAGTSSQGCVATLGASGVPSASATSGFTLTAGGVDGVRQGLLFYGLNGRAALPWGTGTSFLCVKSPTQRTGVQLSGGTAGNCDGQLSLDFLQFVAANPAALGAPLQAGAVVQAQAWYRDPPASKSTSLSNALEFLVQP
jgi:hypothetical protein